MLEQGCSLALESDLDGQLITEPYDKKSEQWLLNDPDDTCLVVRADRKFAFVRSNTATHKWVQF